MKKMLIFGICIVTLIVLLGGMFYHRNTDNCVQDALLVIDGRTIDCENVKVYKKYAVLPLIKTLENSGVVVNWENESVAHIVHEDCELTLNLKTKSLIENKNMYELLQPSLGGTHFFCEIEDDEIMLDSETLGAITNRFLGLRKEYIIDYQNNKVIVRNYNRG